MRIHSGVLLLPLLLAASVSLAQTEMSTSGTATAGGTAVPPAIRFSGALGYPAGAVTVRFALYRDQTGGEALWAETQVVQVDTAGRYAAVLGTTIALAPELFATGAARWLGVCPDGSTELPRVLLVSVPYAMKAADAETVGGKPLSAFVLAGEQTGVGADGLTYVNPQVLKAGLQAAGGPGQTANSGTANYLGVFLNATDLGSSVVYQDPATQRLGVNTTAPLASLHAASNTAPVAFFDVYSNVLTALPVAYRAARGTMLAPSAVQPDDILGGLAVRGYGTSGFSPGGRGQVVFKAAEPWTDTAHGTYLQVNTTPTGATRMVERLRVTAEGNVGIGTTTPGQLLSVAGVIESTSGGVKFPDGNIQTAAAPLVTSGSNNVGLGTNALIANTSGYSNSAVGAGSLAVATGASYNTAVGASSLGATTGSVNTAVGYQAGLNNTNGTSNTFLGAYSGPDASHPGLTNATTVGAYATVSASNTLVLGGTLSRAVSVVVGDTAAAPAGASATSLFTLRKDAQGALGPILTLFNGGGYGGAGGAIDFFTTNVASGGTVPGARLQSSDNNYSADLIFSTKVPGGGGALTERMRLTNAGTLGLNVSSPQAQLDVAANSGIAISGAGTNYGVRGITSSSYSSGVYGHATSVAGLGNPAGVTGQVDAPVGYGVFGTATSSTGATYGVYGLASSANGTGVAGQGTTGVAGLGVTGVFGQTNVNNGFGVEGYADTGTDTRGVYGISWSSGGHGVHGYSYLDVGVYGQSDGGAGVEGHGTSAGVAGFGLNGVFGESSTAQGVYGHGAATTGQNWGVMGRTESSSGTGVEGDAPHGGTGVSGASSTGVGVYGHATATAGTNIGVKGQTESPSGTGVEGDAPQGSDSGYGVAGYGFGNLSIGVYGQSPYLAGLFDGDVVIEGTLIKNAGSFRIDHPLDPANKNLSHSFVESPDMKNVHDGVAVLDEKGEAVILLPDWFEALNRDFRYQLTSIGAFMPLYVAEEIAGNRFKIAGGTAGKKVSWQVTGIRHDAYAEAHRIPVEQEKTPEEKSRHLRTGTSGQPVGSGTDPVTKAGARTPTAKLPIR